MRHWLCVFVLIVTAPLAEAVAQGSASDVLPMQVRNFFDALAKGDTARMGPYLAPDLTWVLGTNGSRMGRRQLLDAVSRAQKPAPRFQIDSLQIRSFGTSAVVLFIRSDRRQLGSSQVVTRSFVSEVYVLNGAQWQLTHHTQTWLVQPVTPHPVNDASIKAFVGRYQIAPGYVDDIRWSEGHLVATATGQTRGARLVPVSENVFSPEAVGSLIAFERDDRGKVRGYVQGFPDGTVFRAVKLPH